jgi:oligopeptide transport system substrate-binding protein
MGIPARVAWSAVVGVAFVLSACGNGSPAGEGSGDRSITVRGCAPENPLVPAMTMESCGGQVVDQLFSKLIRYDPDTAEPLYEIAESIESEDNQTWTIRLKDGWTFHNGEPVTARSFVDAWNWAAYAPNGTLNSYFFQAIEGYAELQPEDATPAGQEITPDMVDRRNRDLHGVAYFWLPTYSTPSSTRTARPAAPRVFCRSWSANTNDYARYSHRAYF